MRIRFDLADPSKDRIVEGIVKTLRPIREAAADGGTLSRETLRQCWPVLLKLSTPAAMAPLETGEIQPPYHRRVAVLGFPRNDARISSPLFAEHFAGAAGEKHYMPGVIIRGPGSSWTFDYDCFTADGVSGGPVIDLETSKVIGMHVAADYPQGTNRKRGVAVLIPGHSAAPLLPGLE